MSLPINKDTYVEDRLATKVHSTQRSEATHNHKRVWKKRKRNDQNQISQILTNAQAMWASTSTFVGLFTGYCLDGSSDLDLKVSTKLRGLLFRRRIGKYEELSMNLGLRLLAWSLVELNTRFIGLRLFIDSMVSSFCPILKQLTWNIGRYQGPKSCSRCTQWTLLRLRKSSLWDSLAEVRFQMQKKQRSFALRLLPCRLL